jgi:NAD(P)H-quinone oxidoreductase subunit 5
MSQLGYMLLPLGIGSYKAGLFHLITHAYSKAFLFLESKSIIHSMEPLVAYSPGKSQIMVFMGGLRKHMPIIGTTFLIGTLSLCGISLLACFWSKDEILANSWFYFPVIGWIAWITVGLIAFYMFCIHFITFEGNLRANSFKESFLVSEATTTKELNRKEKRPISLFADSKINMEREDVILSRAKYSLYPKKLDKIMLFPLLVLAIPTLFLGFI